MELGLSQTPNPKGSPAAVQRDHSGGRGCWGWPGRDELPPHHSSLQLCFLSRRIFVLGIGFFTLCFLMTSLGGQFSAKRLGDSPFTIRTEGEPRVPPVPPGAARPPRAWPGVPGVQEYGAGISRSHRSFLALFGMISTAQGPVGPSSHGREALLCCSNLAVLAPRGVTRWGWMLERGC